MDLQHHTTTELPLSDGAVYSYHRQLDEVGRRALEWRILSVALSVRPEIEIALLHFRYVAAPLEQGLYVPLLPGQLHLMVEEGTNSRKTLEIFGNEPLSVFQRNPQLTAEGKRPLSVDGSKVDRLGASAHFARHFRGRDVEDDGGGLTVNVSALKKR